jgi:hypothetical protein
MSGSSPSQVTITTVALDDPRAQAYYQQHGTQHHERHNAFVAKLRQRRMFAHAAAGITKPHVSRIAAPRTRERKSAPARRTSSSSPTSSADPGDSDEPPAPGWHWAHPAWGWAA